MDINFYSTRGEHGCFSNFSNHPIAMKNRVWKTSEHYYQSQKFVGTEYEEKIRLCKTPREAADMGRDRSLPLRSDWEQVKDDVMRETVLAKFTQNPDLKEILLKTGNAVLIEHTEKDNYWGDGGDGSGKNMLGKILMEVREQLLPEVEDTSLEDAFKLLVSTIEPLIDEQLDIANTAMSKAVALSEQHSLPFSSKWSPFRTDTYVPKSFKNPLADLGDNGEDEELYYDILGFNPKRYGYRGDYSGWESAGWNSSSLTC